MNQKKARETRRAAAGAEPSSNRSSRHTRLLIGGAALLVVAIVGVGLLASRNTGPAQAVSSSSSSIVEISGTDPITGKSVDLASYVGKPVVLNVWGSWCEGCSAEAADLKKFVDRHPEVQMIGIDLQDSKEVARDFYARWGWKHPSIDDPRGEISKSLGLQGTPTTFFLDSSHRIVTRIVGETDLAGFEQGLAAVLSPTNREPRSRASPTASSREPRNDAGPYTNSIPTLVNRSSRSSRAISATMSRCRATIAPKSRTGTLVITPSSTSRLVSDTVCAISISAFDGTQP